MVAVIVGKIPCTEVPKGKAGCVASLRLVAVFGFFRISQPDFLGCLVSSHGEIEMRKA